MSMFRKSSLERLSSPEEIDQLMHITSARQWLALAAVFVLLISACVWGYASAVATTVAGQGAIVRRGGVRNVVTSGAGLLSDLSVHVGDHVHARQVIARVEQPAALERVRLARLALEEGQRERENAYRINADQSRLQLAALSLRDQNAHEQIARLKDQVKLGQEQIAVQEGLQQKGLVTRHQVIESRQQLASLETEIANREADINQRQSDRFGVEKKPLEQDESWKQKILELQAALDAAEKESEIESLVVSPYEGDVIEIKAYAGERVDVQTPVLSVQPSVNDLEVVAYIPSLRAKEVRSGMEVQISPSIVKREEYGFIRGRVLEVGAFPATRAALMRNFENENLITAFAGDSPVTELQVEMTPDPATMSGFRWSSSKGPPILLSGGMLCNLQIVTLRQHPVQLLLPFLRQQVGAN